MGLPTHGGNTMNQPYSSNGYFAPQPAYPQQQQQMYSHANVPSGPPGGSGGMWIRWVMLGGFVGGPLCWLLVMIIASIVDNDDTGILGAIGLLLMGVAWLCTGAWFVSIYAWIFKSWELLPEGARITGSGKAVSPGAAVGMLFIPGFSAYWMFVVSVGYANALNRVLAQLGSQKRAPGGLAMAASICTVIPFVNVLAPILWIAFALVTDSAKADYLKLATQTQAVQQARFASQPPHVGFAPGYGV